MAIQESNLNDIEIRNLLEKEYNIKAKNIRPINKGTANIYNIDNKYILKEFSEDRKKESILKEIDIINFLSKKDIKVPKYIETISKQFYIIKYNRIIIVQEYIDGYTIENNTGDYEKTIESATILGKLLKAFKEYKELDDERIIEKWFSKNYIQNGLKKMQKLKKNLNYNNKFSKKIEKDLDDKIEMSKYILENFDFSIINKMTMQNTHGDYSVQQLIYNDEKGTTLIDFETAKKMPIAWEIIRSYSYIDKDAKEGIINEYALEDYFKEVMKYVKLNEYDLKYAKVIYLIQMLGSIYGYKQYNENVENIEILEFAFFRTNLCRNIFKIKNKSNDLK